MDDNVIIHDTRNKFGSNTFSNFKKSDVVKELINCLYYKKLEESYYWTCELLCSNYIIEIWETFFLFIGKYIHVKNPKLVIYVNKKYQDFKKHAIHVENDIELRNNHPIRIILCSVTTVLTLSEKGHMIENIKQNFDFNIEKLYDNLKAPNMDFANNIFHMHDPKEFFVAMNELGYHLLESKDRIYIHYWINWIVEYDALCSKRKTKLSCHKRPFVKVDSKTTCNNVIWMIWDLLLHSVGDDKNKKIIIHNCLDLFSIKYKASTNKKRLHLIFMCIEMILSELDYSISIIENNNILNTIDENVNITFEIIKKNEVQELHQEKLSKQEICDMVYNNNL